MSVNTILSEGLSTLTVPSCTGSSGAMPSSGMPSANFGPATAMTFSMHWLRFGSDAEHGWINDAGEYVYL